jgi:hypothetical protein
LAANDRHDSRVHLIAPFPSLIHMWTARSSQGCWAVL